MPDYCFLLIGLLLPPERYLLSNTQLVASRLARREDSEWAREFLDDGTELLG